MEFDLIILSDFALAQRQCSSRRAGRLEQRDITTAPAWDRKVNGHRGYIYTAKSKTAQHSMQMFVDFPARSVDLRLRAGSCDVTVIVSTKQVQGHAAQANVNLAKLSAELLIQRDNGSQDTADPSQSGAGKKPKLPGSAANRQSLIRRPASLSLFRSSGPVSSDRVSWK